jgi:hypothetical protein
MSKKDLQRQAEELIQIAVEHGATVIREKTHTIVRPADKTKRQLVVPKTPSDWRGIENLRSDFRKAGFPVPHKGGKKK